MGTWMNFIVSVVYMCMYNAHNSVYRILVFHAGHHKMTISDILSQAFEEMDVPLPTED